MSPPASPADLANINLYAVLDLPGPTATSLHSASPPTTAQIKAAVRHALLLHHPDKNYLLTHQQPTTTANQSQHLPRSTSASAPPSPAPSVDLIRAARSILLSPHLRTEYNRLFLQRREGNGHSSASSTPGTPVQYPTELDTVDLDDMAFSETTQTWSRGCRCGSSVAYEIGIEDLEDAAAFTAAAGVEGRQGELLVGCGGCSLHIRVVFEALED